MASSQAARRFLYSSSPSGASSMALPVVTTCSSSLIATGPGAVLSLMSPSTFLLRCHLLKWAQQRFLRKRGRRHPSMAQSPDNLEVGPSFLKNFERFSLVPSAGDVGEPMHPSRGLVQPARPMGR